MGRKTEALVEKVPERLPCPPAVPEGGRTAVAVRCFKFPGAQHFHKQGTPTVPPGSLHVGPTSFPRTFGPGFPTQAGLSQSPRWLWVGGEMFDLGFSSSSLDCPSMSRGGQGPPGDIPMFIRYNLTASVSSGISRISTSASNTSVLEKLSGSKIFCERRKFT